eukprot:TRINITY_DN12612_c0_g3_i1.p1 TRINITY_DN12612_c0_g3~~TRINITY_DN12612_c0_g3_i1.p1  ORF type:complete len:1310 (-),score=213.17 TRINITY_DN12612_c0_g3_i1:416-4345(-)
MLDCVDRSLFPDGQSRAGAAGVRGQGALHIDGEDLGTILRNELEERIAQVEENLEMELNRWIEAANSRIEQQARLVAEIKAHVEASPRPTEPALSQPIQPVKADPPEAAGVAETTAAKSAPAPAVEERPASLEGEQPSFSLGCGGFSPEHVEILLPQHGDLLGLETQFQEMVKNMEGFEHRLDETVRRTTTLSAEVKQQAERTKHLTEHLQEHRDGDHGKRHKAPANAINELVLPQSPPKVVEEAPPKIQDLEELQKRMTDVEEKVMNIELEKQLDLLVGTQTLTLNGGEEYEVMPSVMSSARWQQESSSMVRSHSVAGVSMEDARNRPRPDELKHVDSPKQEEKSAWMELEKSMLDYGDMYTVNESVWDACLFAFTGYVSAGTSWGLVLVYVLNMFVQVTFMQVVYSYMLDSPVSEDVLSSLLKFRIGIAHDVAFADRTNMRSMARQLCDEDNKLHHSGLQAQLFSDVKQFHDGAMLLVILAQLTWAVTIMNDLASNWRFLKTLLSIRRDSRTVMVCDCESTANEADPSLLASKVVVKMSSLSCCRICVLIVFVVLPRFAIAIILGGIGAMYLGVTASMPDLLLNAMALAFIIDLDEMFYSVFAPRRIQLLVQNFEPTPVIPSRIYLKCPGIVTFGKVVFVGGYLIALFYYSVQPFFTELLQARDILCSGNKDFVVAQNINTGLQYAARSSAGLQLSPEEGSVLQLTQLTLHPESAWTKGLLENEPSVGLLATSNLTMAKIFNFNGDSPPRIEQASFDPALFSFMTNLQTMTIGESQFLPCRDLAASQSKEAAMMSLRTVLRQVDIPECDEYNATSMAWWAPHCGNIHYTLVRTMCPRTCGCHHATAFDLGALQHKRFGCPVQCASLRSVVVDAESMLAVDDACADSSPATFGIMSESFRMKTWFRLYIKNVQMYLMGMPGYRDNLVYNAEQYAASGQFGGETMDSTRLIAHLLDTGPTGFWESLANGTWGVLPDYKSYFSETLEGCAFLTSTDFKWLFSHDLCDETAHFSLRQFCPVSCGCGTMENCPSGCRLNEDNIPCMDEISTVKEVVPQTLAWLLGDASITNCSEIPLAVLIDNCAKRDMKLLRRYCPLRCMCADPPDFTLAGFFAEGPWGCPKACEKGKSASAAYLYEKHPNLTSCEDRQTPYWSVPAFPEQGIGGSAFKRAYCIGLHEYMMSKYNAFQASIFGTMAAVAKQGDQIPVENIPERITEAAQYILHGLWLEPVLLGRYEILPNFSFPSPQGPVNDWCNFMAHWMFKWLVGVDVCSESGEHQSLFAVCPQACRCVSQSGCPLSCSDRSAAQDGNP